MCNQLIMLLNIIHVIHVCSFIIMMLHSPSKEVQGHLGGMNMDNIDLLSTCFNSAKGLTFVHNNVRSLINKTAELTKHYDRVDVLAITETWLHESINGSLIKMDGFNLLRQDRQPTIRKRGGGICCYIKEHLDNTATSKHWVSRYLYATWKQCMLL